MRIRFRFTKLGKIRFTSQRDVARMWERALRRSGLPVAWSEGFSPHPLLSFSLALPTGCESLAEYLDIWTRPKPARPIRAEISFHLGKHPSAVCLNSSLACCPTGWMWTPWGLSPLRPVHCNKR
jgi:hypothetical protein